MKISISYASQVIDPTVTIKDIAVRIDLAAFVTTLSTTGLLKGAQSITMALNSYLACGAHPIEQILTVALWVPAIRQGKSANASMHFIV